MPNAICTKGFLDSFRPVSTKQLSCTNRWGNFMFFCDPCTESLKLLVKQNKVDSSCQTEEQSYDEKGYSELSNINIEAVQNKSDSQLVTETVNSKDMVATVASVVTRNVECMLSSLKDDLLASVESHVSEKIQSALSISSPFSSTFTRHRVPSSATTITSEDLLPMSISSSSVEFSSCDENANVQNSYSHTLGSTELHPVSTVNEKTVSGSNESGSSNHLNVSPKPDDAKRMPQKEDSDHILVLNAQNETVNLHKAEEKLSNLFRNVPINHIKNNIKNKKIVMIFPSEDAKEKGRAVLAKHPDVLNKK
ncbi:hypothetical protein ACHWQZ_G014139 [Mnemiopsis leidyi]